ncbi:MAG: energy-coupling factor ABC transporter ATP-binding protein [Sarcina sp.]
MIKLDNVFFAYRNEVALRNINIEIKDGETVALIGPNGSGKSTMLKLLNGIVNPSKGAYYYNDDEVTQEKLEKSKYAKNFHQRIGFVFQNSDTQLFNSTVYDEIAFGPRQMEISEEEVEKRVNSCMNLLEITKLKERQPYNLSGGEKKKVAIASVLVLNPEVLILDEPMNEIDPKGKRFLRELLLKLKESGKTIICSTHEFAYIEGIFDRCLVFSENHEIVKDGDYKEILENKEFLIENNIM